MRPPARGGSSATAGTGGSRRDRGQRPARVARGGATGTGGATAGTTGTAGRGGGGGTTGTAGRPRARPARPHVAVQRVLAARPRAHRHRRRVARFRRSPSCSRDLRRRSARSTVGWSSCRAATPTRRAPTAAAAAATTRPPARPRRRGSTARAAASSSTRFQRRRRDRQDVHGHHPRLRHRGAQELRQRTCTRRRGDRTGRATRTREPARRRGRLPPAATRSPSPTTTPNEIRVCRTRTCAAGDETNVYYLNADTGEGHWTYVMNYAKPDQGHRRRLGARAELRQQLPRDQELRPERHGGDRVRDVREQPADHAPHDRDAAALDRSRRRTAGLLQPNLVTERDAVGRGAVGADRRRKRSSQCSSGLSA